jgi:ATP/maltotriose-dependent transcriptional regulator MalT
MNKNRKNRGEAARHLASKPHVDTEHLSGADIQEIFSERHWARIAESLRFSGRETQIVRGIFDDDTEHGIGERFGMSQHTVHTHLQRLYRKLGVSSRTQLILRVFGEYMALNDHA